MTSASTVYFSEPRDLEDVQHVGRQVRRDRARTRPASRRSRRSGTGTAPSCVSCACAIVARSPSASMSGSANASPRSAASSSASARDAALFGAAVRILDEIARAFAEADHRRRRQLEAQPAEAGDDAGRQRRASRAPRRSCRRRPRPFPARPAPRPGSRPRTRRSRCRSRAVIWMRALPIALRDGVEPHLRPRRRRPIAAGCLRLAGDLEHAGSRLRMVTIAVPFVFSWLVTTAPNDAVSPTRQEARERRLQRHRLVDADLAVGRPEARRLVGRHRHDPVGGQRLGQRDVDASPGRWRRSTTEPSQKASTRKSLRIVPAPGSSPPPPPSSPPFGVSTRRLTMRWRLSVVITCSAFST